jgi:hypothetical protein
MHKGEHLWHYYIYILTYYVLFQKTQHSDDIVVAVTDLILCAQVSGHRNDRDVAVFAVLLHDISPNLLLASVLAPIYEIGLFNYGVCFLLFVHDSL